MENISTILVPFDFSESANQALEYTVDYIGDSKIKIVLVHIAPDPNSVKDEGFKVLNEKYARNLKIPMEWLVSKNSLAETIVEIQNNKKADLVIMGTSGSKNKIGTTNTAELVLATDCPVIVVPKNIENFSIKNISLVLGVNEIEDTSVLATLLNVTKRFNAKVHVLTVQNEPGTYGYSKADEKNENALMYYLEDFYAEHTFIENQDILEGIFSYVDSHSIDMIAVMPRNHTSKSAPSKGLLTKELTMRSAVPVLALD
ncbi:nucleotide-binding universal stress UspA family protein [Saonia flava]|uniref:Nucleotide-binding universal stress UspA family protein n=1 Tax=Saonia flava TaxID=523696 RepID=A0A846QT19_9FLAO|nr:universal stress protein [Saonia flava]NJB71331.1 nucleotide-binding universal stress UspA family protein [Saonia flava]